MKRASKREEERKKERKRDYLSTDEMKTAVVKQEPVLAWSIGDCPDSSEDGCSVTADWECLWQWRLFSNGRTD